MRKVGFFSYTVSSLTPPPVCQPHHCTYLVTVQLLSLHQPLGFIVIRTFITVWWVDPGSLLCTWGRKRRACASGLCNSQTRLNIRGKKIIETKRQQSMWNAVILTSQATSTLILALDGCKADRLLALFLVVIAIGLQVATAQASLMLLLPYPPLLGLPADGGSQPLLLFLPRQTRVANLYKNHFKAFNF